MGMKQTLFSKNTSIATSANWCWQIALDIYIPIRGELASPVTGQMKKETQKKKKHDSTLHIDNIHYYQNAVHKVHEHQYPTDEHLAKQ